ncbi:hypothetical protein [Streptomyces sp. R35]|uniref:Nephrocystin 3-like N-terminal domain-containing protein n=1 Tax=Streptomyces sp. R35 TaxID=3238630 RepID=A0AB39RSY3_9ACTN
MVRALVAGVGDFPEAYLTEEDRAAGRVIFGPLPAVRDAVEKLARSLQDNGVIFASAPLEEPDGDALRKAWKDLRDASRSEPLIMHFAGHGIRASASGVLYLVCKGGDPEALGDTCLPFTHLLETAEEGGRPVLLLLDVCGGGHAITEQYFQEQLAQRPQDAHRNLWVIAACAGDQITYGARFTTAATSVLDRLAEGLLDVSPDQEYVPVDTLAKAIDREMKRSDRADKGLGQSVVRTPHAQAVSEPQPFLPNPTHSTDPHAQLVARLRNSLLEFALNCDPGLDPLHFAAHAAGNARADAIQFSGRKAELERIRAWIDNTDGTQDRLLVAIGSPGSGKSALLGVITCMTHPEIPEPLRAKVRSVVTTFRPHQPDVVLAVHARQRDLEQVTETLHRQLDLQLASAPAATPGGEPDDDHDCDTGRHAQPVPNTPEALMRRLDNVGDVLVIVDALDEAADPAIILDQLLFPLSGTTGGGPRSGCRVTIGTRPWWDTLPTLHQQLVQHRDRVLDLDPVNEDDFAHLACDLREYLDRLLDRRCTPDELDRIADQLARYSDSGAFLVAALYANHLLACPEAIVDPPRSITEVFDLEQRTLASAEPWTDPVLAVLGQARGQGMPLELIHEAACAHAPERAQQQLPPNLKNTRRALTKAAFYLRTTPDTDRRLLYRYFHQALTDHTAPLTDPATLYTALLDTASHNWAQAHPYLLRHAADHAAAVNAEALDQLLENPCYLLRAEPDTLTPHLHHAATEQAILHARIYRTTTAHHPERHQRKARRDLLALDAVCWQQPQLAHTFATLPIADRTNLAEPRWATNRTADPALLHILKGHRQWVIAVATLELRDGTPVAVTASGDGTAIVWNLVTGQRVHTLEGHSNWVNAVATAVLTDGTPVAVTASGDGTAIVWNLVTGQRVHTLEGHSNSVNAVATALLTDGTPVAVTASDDHTAIVWNLDTGRSRGSFEEHEKSVVAVATLVQPNGIRVAVTASADGATLVWKLDNCTRRRTLEVPSRWVHAVATAVLPDRVPAAVTTTDKRTAIVWNLNNRRRIHTLEGHQESLNGVATTQLSDGTPVAVTVSADHTAIVWDMDSGQCRRALEAHTKSVTAVATSELPNGTPLAITVSDDRTAIVWNLDTNEPRCALEGHTKFVHGVATGALRDGTRVAVTASDDERAIIWNLDNGQRLGRLEGHARSVRAVATSVLNGETRVAVTAHDDRIAIVWDLDTGQRIRALPGHSARLNDVATGIRDDARVAVTASDDGTAIVSNLANGECIHTLKSRKTSVNAVATLMPRHGPPVAVTAHSDGTAMIWDLDNGDCIRTLEGGHVKPVRTVAALKLPTNILAAVTAGDDGTTIVWNLDNGERIHTLRGHNGPVNDLATLALPEGTLAVVTVSEDRTAIVWNLENGQQVWQLALPAEGRCISATDAGFVVCYGREVAHFQWTPQVLGRSQRNATL